MVAEPEKKSRTISESNFKNVITFFINSKSLEACFNPIILSHSFIKFSKVSTSNLTRPNGATISCGCVKSKGEEKIITQLIKL